MKNYKIKKFANESKHISNFSLKETLDFFCALDDIGKQRYSLGSNLYKLRVATNNKGKSGSSRTIIVFSDGKVCYWVHCFNKNEKENFTTRELKDFKKISGILLSLSDSDIKKLIEDKKLFEVI
ncbi:type II toxin-antitoxin system RelE/ParE family toxin [Cysteiniphilum halobium]|uniref:type II toxin-antitoxin system RelE/ParE family toxin n=1 Tax=Cysteiniphilum halobium TaxID=2219059 RepID=UPI000E6461B8|nr:type II toxin-antitoxin system RelE/ParE family toxin [Cysteiniphilum halobium]